jgi:hypothetical protein
MCAIPELLVPRRPLHNPPERSRVQCDGVLAPAASTPHQPGPLEHSDVLGHRGERHLERLSHVSDARWSAPQPIEDGASGGISNRTEHVIE